MKFVCILKLFLSLCVAGCLGEAPDHPNITLYDSDNFHGSSLSTTEEISYLEKDNQANSICGWGLWFLYEDFAFDTSSSFVHTFAHRDYACENLDFTQVNLISSVRFAGGLSIYEESLTLYKDYRFCGNQLVTMKNLVDVGDYTEDFSSFAVLGNSSWTIYKDRNFEGDSVCLEPSLKNNLFYGLFDSNSLGFPNDSVDSVKKGCHSSRKGKQIDIL